MKIINFAKKAEEKNLRGLADEICESYKRMGVTLTREDKSRIRKKLASEIYKDVLTGSRVVCSVSKEVT